MGLGKEYRTYRKASSVDSLSLSENLATEALTYPRDARYDVTVVTCSSGEASTRAELRRINKNVFTINVAFMLLFAAFAGLSIVQSSVFGAVGTTGLGLTFGSSTLSCLVLASAMVRVLGCKRTMLLCFCGFLAWMASSFYSTWATVIPASLLMGVANGPIWTAQATYFTAEGLRYAALAGEPEDAVIARLFGLFFCFLLFGTSIGCAITSGVLSLRLGGSVAGTLAQDISHQEAPLHAENVSNVSASSTLLPHCGAGFCPDAALDEGPSQLLYLFNGSQPNDSAVMVEALMSTNVTPKENVYILVAIHCLLTIIALLMVALLVDPLPPTKDKDKASSSVIHQICRSLKATMSQLRRKRQILMVPLNVYIGLSQSFVLAEITQAWVACALGVEMLGYATMTYGMSACLASVVSGFLIKGVGRLPVYTTAGLVRLGSTLFLLLWTPDASATAIFFLIPALWAFGDGIYLAQINAFYGSMFYDNSEGAFAAYRFYEGVGMGLGYVYNSALCVKYKLIICLLVHCIGWLLYYVCEVIQHRFRRDTVRTIGAVKDTEVIFAFETSI